MHESKLRKRVDFYFGPGGPQEARVASGECFLLVFAENVVMVEDFRLGRLENTAPVHKSKLRKRVDFDFGPGGPQEARVASGGCCCCCCCC